MKNTIKKLILVIISILLLFALYVLRSYRYVHMVATSQYMFFYEAVGNYYDKYGDYPDYLSQIDSLIPYKVKRAKNLYDRISLQTKENTPYFYFSSKLNFDNKGKLSWPLLRKRANLELFSVMIPRKPKRKFRIICENCNEDTLKEELQEMLNKFAVQFKQDNSIRGDYIEYKTGDVTFSYSNESEFYFYTSHYKIDSLKEEYIIGLKHKVIPLLDQNKVEKINMPVQLPEQTPIPPFNEGREY